ncbi:MAG: aldehyde dehydrogenase family protein [Acidobacteria bacterium]|nr:aldehyde dehydrogenase family protein [Acidobacteriota bacterium]NIM63175.1 aldehyde dehydrogenase family protein [Acidobacteriota bacterium]NIO59563.1 aldehyde dehydrogenase family protein [Acidobacteriota bacterium]NIQ30577.1 aldehyde dehydrogenase family protein [Acidobacteriota bacterium]NIQ85543.1 aldehyde dehydrogenase family protein [Acidobacteriota bacterium]
MQRILNYIDGELVEAANGGWLDNVEPATGKVYSRLPDSDETDIEKAVAAAKQAFPGWSGTPAVERARIMDDIADRIEADLESFARAESIDTGKPIGLARKVEIPRAVSNLRFFAGAIQHTASEAHVTDDQALNYTLRRPRGVAGLISPWNLPLYLLTWKVAPAIATGNTAVAKPSELTPMTAHLLAQTCRDAGLPPGVLNIVHGLGARAGAPLTTHPDVPTISFTGGTATGGTIAAATATSFKKLALEMGGKNPTVVFADADMDVAVPTAVQASFSNQGQICLCGSRIFVQRDAYDAFVDRFVSATGDLVQGDPLEETTNQGAVVSKAHFDKVMGYIDLAKEEGGTILAGGSTPSGLPDRCREGFFIEPTVVTGLPHDCRVNREEIFGPVTSIMPFDAEDEVIEWANETDYGLSASVWTQDVSRAHRVAERIASGTVWVNCWLLRDLRVPFGGMKQSGVGREGGDEALRFFTEPKNVCLRLGSS